MKYVQTQSLLVILTITQVYKRMSRDCF